MIIRLKNKDTLIVDQFRFKCCIGKNGLKKNKVDINFVQFIDVFSGLVKASVFGFLITFMGCYHGFNAKGGAQGVGQSTTYSVVSSSILILLMNYIITSFFFRL